MGLRKQIRALEKMSETAPTHIQSYWDFLLKAAAGESRYAYSLSLNKAASEIRAIGLGLGISTPPALYRREQEMLQRWNESQGSWDDCGAEEENFVVWITKKCPNRWSFFFESAK